MKINPDLILLFKSDGMADGEQDLRRMVLTNFLKNLADVGVAPKMMMFMGKGIFLTTEGSYIVDTLKLFEAAGTKISSCGTCLEYYDRKQKIVVGDVGNMKGAVEALLAHSKLIQIS